MLLLLIGVVACGDATVVMVSVTSKCNLTGLSSLMVSLQQGTQTRSGPVGEGAVSLPTSFVIRADGWQGDVTLLVSGHDSKQQVVGLGSVDVTLVRDQQVEATLVLNRADFQANTVHQHDQIFSLKASGRQLAASKNGTFVVGWKDHLITGPKNQYNLYYRLFDAKGKASLNSAGKSDQVRINSQQSQLHENLALAIQHGGGADGHFVAAMAFLPSGGTGTRIRVKAFSPKGSPRSESTLGLTGGAATVPDIDQLNAPGKEGGEGYIVVWQEKDVANNKWKIMAHLLDIQGKPSAPPLGSVAPFKVAEFTYNELSEPMPVVAGGDGGFMVVWRESSSATGRGNLKATAFGSKNASYNELKPARFAVAHLQTGKVREFNIGRHKTGYAVIWTDEPGYKPDTDGTSIRFRRFSYSGQPKEKEYTLNTAPTGNQEQPSVAMRDDGSLLAVWSSIDTNGGKDSLGGIRGRRILSNGLPVGHEIQVNTTTPRSQTYPSVHGQSGDAFVVAFMDRSGVGPDTLGTGIRARVFCPDYRPQNGSIGALCDASHPCSPSLVCQKLEVGNRCVAQCSGSGGACHHGGECSQDKATQAWMCLY